MSQKAQFRVSRHDLKVSRDDVESRLNTIKEQPITKVWVEVGEKRFPVKQALAEVGKSKGLIKSSFTTQDAVRVFNGLGFKVGEKKKKG